MSKETSTIQRRNFIKILGLGAVATASSALAAQGGNSDGGNSGGLTEKQKDTLYFIFQEEKVARDVYITLGKLYPDETTFSSIQLSEQEHILSAQVLCERYGIDTSAVNLSLEDAYVGLFDLKEMQNLYDDCVELGQSSLLEAIRVGILIEVTDIADLEEASVGMPSDVVNTYENLKDGSLSHLAAFEASEKSLLSY